MNNFGIFLKDTTRLLLSSTLNYNFRNFKKEFEEFSTSDSNISLLIIDETFDLDIHIHLLKLTHKVVLLGDNTTMNTARYLLKNNLLFDIISKRDLILLDDIISKYKKISNQYLKMNTALASSLVKVDNIVYISYDRLSRRSIFTVFSNNSKNNCSEYFSKSSLGDIEILLDDRFTKIERGIIINLKKLISIDLKEELLIFENEIKLPLSRRTLNKVKELGFYYKNYIEV